MHPLQVQNFQLNAYRDKNFFLASQNTTDPTIFVWDLYSRRSGRQPEERAADSPDFSLCFPDDADIFNFRWQKNSAYLYSTSGLREQPGQTYLSIFQVRLVEQSLGQLESLEDLGNGHRPGNGEHCDVEERQKVSFRNPQKNHSFVKLPFTLKNFCVNDRNRNYVFGAHERAKLVLDFNSPKDLKYFDREEGERASPSGPDQSDCEVTFNGKNYVIFSNKNVIQIYDIRKEGEKLIEINLNSEVNKIDIDPFNEDEFVAVLEDYLVRININCFYECIFFGQLSH